MISEQIPSKVGETSEIKEATMKDIKKERERERERNEFDQSETIMCISSIEEYVSLSSKFDGHASWEDDTQKAHAIEDKEATTSGGAHATTVDCLV
uniref:Uncharacterized protein n=1 Tax=Cucumis melo TaxID=3656 RepID=A0A9I9CYF4_CUCME